MTLKKPEPQYEGRVLSLAGLDPSGGAGLLGDIKTISAHRCFGTGIVTAQTVQNTMGVSHVEAVDEFLIEKQLKAVLDDMGINAIKIGMLHNESIVQTIVSELKERAHKYIVVLDPIINSSSGAKLISDAGIKSIKADLFSYIDVLTPNIPEAEVLTGVKITSKEHMVAAAEIILEQGVGNVLLTGGHLDGDMVVDVLLTPSGLQFFESEKINAPNNHGTGCALSTSLTCYLSQGLELSSAVKGARAFVQKALRNSENIGQGNGPIGLDGYKHV
jgi:hydroxymethylpyrimidine/phosphomethylpyrimidine kinase